MAGSFCGFYAIKRCPSTSGCPACCSCSPLDPPLVFLLTNCGNFICCTAWIEAESNLLPQRQQISLGPRLMRAASKAANLSPRSLPSHSLPLSFYGCLLLIITRLAKDFRATLVVLLASAAPRCFDSIWRPSLSFRLLSALASFQLGSLLALLTNFSHIFVMSNWFFSSWNETEIESEH